MQNLIIYIMYFMWKMTGFSPSALPYLEPMAYLFFFCFGIALFIIICILLTRKGD